MKLIVIPILILCSIVNTNAQTNLTVRIIDSKTKEPLMGAVVNIEGSAIGNTADTSGLVLLTGIHVGKQIVRYIAIGYVDRYDTLAFPPY